MTARSCASRTEKAGAAGGRRHAPLIGQQLEHDGRRRQGEARADDDGRRRTPAGERYDAGDRRGAEQELQAAEPEHQPAHGDEALEGELQADQEQQEHDAQLGEGGHVVLVDHGQPVERRDLLLEGAEPQRPKDGTRTQIAEHRGQPEAAPQRHDDAGRAQHDEGVAVGVDVECGGHGPFVDT